MVWPMDLTPAQRRLRRLATTAATGLTVAGALTTSVS